MGRAPVPRGLGGTCCGNGTFNGELTVSDRKNAFARTANQWTCLRYWPRRTGSERRNNSNNDVFEIMIVTFRYNYNVEAAMRKYRQNSAYSDNDSTQWRSRDAWQRLTPTTIATTHGKIGGGGPWKRRIVRFKKNGLVRFDKSVLFRFEKNGFFAFRKADLSLWKKRIFRSSNGRLRASRSKGFDSNRRVTNVGSTNLTLSKHGELLYTTIIGRGWEYSVVYFQVGFGYRCNIWTIGVMREVNEGRLCQAAYTISKCTKIWMMIYGDFFLFTKKKAS